MRDKPHILIVDDNPEMLFALAPLLRVNGYTAFEALTGTECLRLARERHPDLILLDVVLPDINGIDVCRQIKADPALRNIFVILISGQVTSMENRIAGLGAGADEYIARPIAVPELLARLHSMRRIHEAVELLQEKEEEIRRFNHELEARVVERTAELERINQRLTREIADRKLAEEARAESEKRIVEAQETERRRVARELHDSVHQLLAMARFRIQSVEERLHHQPQDLSCDLENVRKLLSSAQQEVRRISQNLRPSELDDLGLVAAIRSACEEFTERTGIKLDFECSNLARVSTEFELALYRIFQEALSNAEKHAHATSIRVELSRDLSVIRLKVSDNGKGFFLPAPKTKSPAKSGLGLVNMRERASFVGGNLTVKSQSECGTEITVEIPWDRSNQAEPAPHAC
jgi:signal transduction histidine kinase